MSAAAADCVCLAAVLDPRVCATAAKVRRAVLASAALRPAVPDDAVEESVGRGSVPGFRRLMRGAFWRLPPTLCAGLPCGARRGGAAAAATAAAAAAAAHPAPPSFFGRYVTAQNEFLASTQDDTVVIQFVYGLEARARDLST